MQFQVEEKYGKRKKKSDKNQNLMGGTGSSSKIKSSKKKSSKNYSQVSRKKKKIRRNESKKRRRRHGSDDDSISSASISASSSGHGYKSRKSKYKKIRRDYSISSDDNSVSAASDSLSSLHNDYRSRKAKSGSQLKKKRTRERSIGPDRNKNSRDVKKRKRSKRSHDSKPKKKSLKKSKKHTRVNSSSSDSQSCSTCRSRSNDGTTEIGRAKLMFDKEIERARGRDAVKVHRKRKVRSPSCSSCSRDNDHSVSQTEVVATANSSRRLRSVIAVVVQPHDREENKWESDPNKEEIMYNLDDFPSPRSIEIDDVQHKGDSPGASNKKSRLETVRGEEVTERSFTSMEGIDQKNNIMDAKSNEVDSNTLEKKRITDVSVSMTDLGGDDLESILRQKALDNLRKFRGGLQKCTANQKIDNESNINNFSSAGANIIQNKSTKQDSSNVASKACLTRETDHSSAPTLKRNLSHHKEINKDISGHEDVGKELSTNKNYAMHPTAGAALSIHSENEDCATAHAVITKPASTTDLNQVAGATNECNAATMESTCVEPTSGENTLKDPQNEAKDGSQFEQKRMSVMRGGEMVEVSYKVYIPKRAPALARRHLRR